MVFGTMVMDANFTAGGPAVSQSTIQQLIDQYLGEFKGAIVNHVTTQCQDQGRLLEETKRDLEVFKKAYYKAERDMHDREAWFEQEKQSLNDEIHQLKAIEAREKRVVVLIDGDGAIFLPSLIAEGKKGGHEAASRLSESIKAHLDPHQFQLHVYVFHNRRGLITTLKRCGHVDAAAMFDDFVVGFNQAAERFAMIDAGELKEGSDHKMRAYLDDNIYSAQTLKVLFGGCHDNGYVSALNSFITSGHKEKLILLPGYADMAVGIEKLGLPSLPISDLFLAEKISLFPADRTPTPPTSPTPHPPPPGLTHPSSPGIVRSTIPQNVRESCTAPVRRGSDPGIFNRPVIEGAVSYKSAVQGKALVSGDSYAKSAVNNARGSPIPPQIDNSDATIMGVGGYGSPLRRINPKIPVWKHTPPPCTLFYLANCKFGSECQYGHDYVLSEDDYESIRANAKNNPCTAIMKGEECPWGSKCVYGHVCPAGPRCPRRSFRGCKFSGEGMHTVA